MDDVKRIWGVDVKGEDVNVFTLDKTGVTGGFGYTASVPKIIDEVRHDAVIVIEKYETHGKVQGRAAYHRCGRHPAVLRRFALRQRGRRQTTVSVYQAELAG
ncbi:MAG: hypothetical protein L6V82_07365 [Clostridiales bacterium]|nr:MAG: hypothetical protein L6V82_07365 [Clostridiales bacterium]